MAALTPEFINGSTRLANTPVQLNLKNPVRKTERAPSRIIKRGRGITEQTLHSGNLVRGSGGMVIGCIAINNTRMGIGDLDL